MDQSKVKLDVKLIMFVKLILIIDYNQSAFSQKQVNNWVEYKFSDLEISTSLTLDNSVNVERLARNSI